MLNRDGMDTFLRRVRSGVGAVWRRMDDLNDVLSSLFSDDSSQMGEWARH